MISMGSYSRPSTSLAEYVFKRKLNDFNGFLFFVEYVGIRRNTLFDVIGLEYVGVRWITYRGA